MVSMLTRVMRSNASIDTRELRCAADFEALAVLGRDDALAGAVRLVEAGIVVERRHPIEPERYFYVYCLNTFNLYFASSFPP